MTTTPESQDVRADGVRDKVREGYKTIALTGVYSSGVTPHGAKSTPPGDLASGGSCCGPTSSCCGGDEASNGGASGGGWSATELAEKIGYEAEQLAALPEGANMGLSCGNPTAIGKLKEGEVVVDLGSGGGFDCFLAGPKVGATGRVIGVDMTAEMISRARRNAVSYRKTTGLDNVEFRLGEIEHLPIGDGVADVVISNCVINLSPDKAQVFREIGRVLKSGGRVAVSDIVLLKSLPAAVLEMVEAMVGCVAGAVLISEYERGLRDAGLERIEIRQKPEYVKALESFQDPLYARIQQALPAGARISEYLASVDLTAVKS
ncbi:MAG: arsenite methyltransferase [Phycisphaeraceae bacterium]|nr:arsenite methyltransferase [Phycisphaeraceae bacterium]